MIKQDEGVHGFAVAPMLDWTDRHCRYFYRLMTKNAWLYSEMVTTGAIIYGNNLPRFLGMSEAEGKVALQLGGSSPQDLAHCAKLGQDWGYSAINLNVGCPSDRVQNNMIGACLMEHPSLVAECVAAMKDAQDLPVTVKHRIGVDEQESLQELVDFVGALDEVGVDGVVIHARKAWLQGLSPKENREVPPLNYPWVHEVKKAFPDLPVMLNGGIKDAWVGVAHLADYEGLPGVDGVMMGRAVYENPFLLTEVDGLYFGCDKTTPTRGEVLEQLYPYVEDHLAQGGRLHHISRHLMGLFASQPGGRKWRRYLSQEGTLAGAGVDTLQEAYKLVVDETKRIEEFNALS